MPWLAARRGDHTSELQRLADSNSAALAAQQQGRPSLEQQLAALAQQRYLELTPARDNTDRLATDFAATHQRLLVRFYTDSCPGLSAAGATGLDDGAGARADLHPAVAQDVVRVTGRADEGRARLTALQEWAKAVNR